MPTRNANFWNFNLFDFFVGVISGIVAIVVFYSLFPDYVISEIPQIDGIVILLVVLIISYVLGRLLQATAQAIERNRVGQRKPFEAELEDSGENSVYSQFLDRSQDYFDINISEGDGRDTDLESLFMLTRAHLTNNNISPRVERFHASYLLFLNLSFIFSAGAIAHSLAMIAQFADFEVLSITIPGTIVLVILLAAGAILSYHQRLWYHERMAKVMIYDFFADTANLTVQDMDY